MNRKKIIITQRRDKIIGRNETREALDVNLFKLIWDLGYLPIPLSSEVDSIGDYLTALAPDGCIISGGNDIGTQLKRDELEKSLLEYSIIHNLPVLGICRGMQFINHYQGGRLVPIDGHVATNHNVSGTLTQNKHVQVNSFHNFGINFDTLGSDLEVLAMSEDDSIEAICHKKHLWLGVMWHPEREKPWSDRDLRMIRTHLDRVT